MEEIKHPFEDSVSNELFISVGSDGSLEFGDDGDDLVEESNIQILKNLGFSAFGVLASIPIIFRLFWGGVIHFIIKKLMHPSGDKLIFQITIKLKM